MTGVVAPVGRYREALAELPLRARLVDRARGAIVVVTGGAGWIDAALDAASDGALAVVIAEPEFAPSADVRRLAEAVGFPVILERPLLRTDAADDARAGRGGEAGWAAPRAVVVDGGASRSRLRSVARDAVGWVRVLTGDLPELVTPSGMPALLETGAGVPATLSVVATARPGGGWLRAHALGEVITEVDVEGRVSRVTTATVAGRLIAPTRFESSERLAVRRALAAVETGEEPHDIDDLRADTELVERMLPPAP